VGRSAAILTSKSPWANLWAARWIFAGGIEMLGEDVASERDEDDGGESGEKNRRPERSIRVWRRRVSRRS
jgi:hypothetical protein